MRVHEGEVRVHGEVGYPPAPPTIKYKKGLTKPFVYHPE